MSDVVISAAKSFPDVSTLALLSDVQYFEPYSSGAVNRKLRGIVSPGIYTGFTPSAAGGLTLLISSGDDGGTASIDIGKLYQISIRQQADITLEMTAGKTAIVVLETTYVIGQETYQVNASSSIQAASIKLLEGGTELGSNQLELCTVTIPSGATELTDEMIDVSNRKLVTLGISLSNDYDSDSEDEAITPKGVKDGLAKKQPLDDTLSELSGKTVDELLEYLRLGDAAKRAVGTGTNQIPDMSSWTSGTNWRRAPDGFIEQWGIIQITAAGEDTQVTFPISFISECKDVQLTYSPANISATLYSASVKHTSLSKTGFIVGGSAAGNTAIRYRAIGK